MKKVLISALLVSFSLGLLGGNMTPIGTPLPSDSLPANSFGIGSGIVINYDTGAFERVQEDFVGRDVDYYVSERSNKTFNVFFVDAEPMLGWEHECYKYLVIKSTNVLKPGYEVSIDTLRMPPVNQKFTPIEVRARYGEAGKIKPYVKKAPMSQNGIDVAGHTYAVILSGGASPTANYNRYWNDCSFIYQTLVNKYGVPKENIFPIMSDGDDPGEDMWIITEDPRRTESQPLDLDFDGVDDISLAANKSNLNAVFGALADKLTSEDHLFLYVIDHGGRQNGGSVIYLWNNETLSVAELNAMLDPLVNNAVNINVVLGQCYSGGFINGLQRNGIVATSACYPNQQSYACPEGSSLPYDEYVYQWTCAINEADHLGKPLSDKVDMDGNGRITMQEAFKYASTHDRWFPTERPMYASTPKSIGEDLAFDNIPPEYDLYIKDDVNDTGAEPNVTAENLWSSPSIWVRNKKDGIEEHENPYISEDHLSVCVYVKIHNRGKNASPAKQKWIHLYCANASTYISDNAWKGRELDFDGRATGGHCKSIRIDEAILPGDSITKFITWALPEDMLSDSESKFHYCLMVKLLDTPYDETFQEGKIYFKPKEFNDQAQKNVTIIKSEDLDEAVKVIVRNPSTSEKSYALKLTARTQADKNIFTKALVEMEMSPKVSNAWARGGKKGIGIYQMSNSPITNFERIKLETAENKLEGINLYGKEFDHVAIKFNFKEPSTSSDERYTVDLVQYDEDGNVLGGETFIVEPPTKSQTIIEIKPVPTTGGLVQLSTNSTDFKSVSWRNNAGETIGYGEDISVKPTIGNDTFEVVGYSEDGGMAVASISLEGEYGIKSLSPAASVGDELTVELCSETADNATMAVSSVVDGSVKITKALPVGTSEGTLDVSALQPGLYTVTYMTDGEVTDSRKFTKK